MGEEKKCNKCRKVKPIEEFSKKKDGDYIKKCDKCREHQKLYNEVNKEREKERKRIKYSNEEERLKRNENNRISYNKNKEEICRCRVLKNKDPIIKLKRKKIDKKYNISFGLYITWIDKIGKYEECRKDPNDSTLLQVKCTKCDKWFNPTNLMVKRRLLVFNVITGAANRFYCSQVCKDKCDIFRKQKYPHNKNPYSNREGSKFLRKIVLERDEHTCQKCYSTKDLECHHIIPVKIDKTLMNNPDNCITLCHDCHMEAHSDYDCTVVYLRNL